MEALPLGDVHQTRLSRSVGMHLGDALEAVEDRAQDGRCLSSQAISHHG
jgi:hypothetical protein